MKIGNKTYKKRVIGLTVAAVIIAIMFIPTLYSFTYLKAFWDPYGNLDKIPVAFVNLDKKVTKDDKTYDLGKDLEDKLKDNKKVKWVFTSYEDAKKGVEGTEYYAMIVVPQDFSQKIANSSDGKFDKAELIYESNKGKNFIFSQISEKVEDTIKNEVALDYAKETSKTMVDNLYDIKGSLSDAKDGTSKLLDGTVTLKDGSSKLLNGTNQLLDGTNQLKAGGNQLTTGLAQAADGSKQLQDGIKQAAAGQNQVVSGFDPLIGGLQQLNSQLTQKNPKVGELVQGADSLSSNVKALKEGVTQNLTQSSQQLAGAAQGISNYADAIAAQNQNLNTAMQHLQAGQLTDEDRKNIMTAIGTLDAVQKGLKSNIATPLQSAATASDPKNNELVAKLGLLETGANDLDGGVKTLVQGISDNQKAAADGTTKLIAGAQQLKAGASQISSGLNTATAKTGDLSSGIDQLRDGSTSLNDGISSLNTGAANLNSGMSGLNDGISEVKNGVSDLNSGLSDGYDKLNDKLKFKSDDLGNFVSDPVSTNDKSINNVKYYGEGLAPYFISLSLWLGALFISVVITIARFAKVVKNKFLRTFTGKALVGSAYASVQAIILSFVLIKGLNIDLTNTTTFYLNNIFISVVFFLAMYGVSYALGALGSPVLFVAMILQLSSCAGTFPIETAPRFYEIINKYLPMTYAVKLLRFVISGMDYALYFDNIRIMLMFAAGCAGCGFVIRTTINLVKKKRHVRLAKKLEAA